MANALQSVSLALSDRQTRLYISVHQGCPLHFSEGCRWHCIVCRDRCPTGKGCNRASPFSWYEDRVLQPLIHGTQNRKWVTTNIGCACFEAGPSKATIQLTSKCIFWCIYPKAWFTAIDLKDAYVQFWSFQATSHSCGLSLKDEHISTRSCPSGCPCCPMCSQKMWRQPLFPWESGAFTFSTTSATGSY